MCNEKVDAAEKQLLLQINGPQRKKMGDWLKVSSRPNNVLTDRGRNSEDNSTDLWEKTSQLMRGDGLQKWFGRAELWREGGPGKAGLREGLNANLTWHWTFICCSVPLLPLSVVNRPNLIPALIPVQPRHRRALSLLPALGQSQWFQDFLVK